VSRRRKKLDPNPIPQPSPAAPAIASPPDASPHRRSTLFHLALLFLISLALYLPTLRNDFITDDKMQILQNPVVTESGNLSRAFTGDVWSFAFSSTEVKNAGSNYYRPLQLIVYFLEFKVFGQRPWLWHLVNVLLNAVVVCLVYLVLAALASSSLAFLTAFWFALHAIHTEPVTWIAALPELQCAIFLLLALLFYHRAKTRGPASALTVLSLLCFSAALFTKETALLYPLILLAYEYFLQRATLRRPRPWLVPVLLSFIPLALYLVLRISALGGFAPTPQVGRADLSLWDTLLAAPPVFARYLSKLTVPIGMNYFYAFPLPTSFQALTFVGLLLAAALATAAILFRNRNPLFSFSIAWFFLTLAPAFNFKSIGINFFTERYLYIPSLGFCILAASGVRWLSQKAQSRSAQLSLALPVLLLFLFYVVQIERRIPIFHDDLSIYSFTAVQSPNSSSVQGALAAAYFEHGDVDRAIECATLAIALDSHNDLTRLGLAWYYVDKKQYDQAIEQLQVVLHSRPDYVPAWINLAKVYTLKRDWPHALEIYQRSAQRYPAQAAFFDHLSTLVLSEQNRDSQLTAREANVDRNPQDASSLILLGDAAAQAGHWPQAADAYERAAQIRPSDFAVLSKWGISLQKTGRHAEAIAVLSRALALQPSSIIARQLLAYSLSSLGRFPEAIREWQEILRLNPRMDHADQMHLSMGLTYEKMGNPAAALAEYRQALQLNPELDAAQKRIAALAAKSP
jgi:protein O-mannosyl-transferase